MPCFLSDIIPWTASECFVLEVKLYNSDLTSVLIKGVMITAFIESLEIPWILMISDEHGTCVCRYSSISCQGRHWVEKLFLHTCS